LIIMIIWLILGCRRKRKDPEKVQKKSRKHGLKK